MAEKITLFCGKCHVNNQYFLLAGTKDGKQVTDFQNIPQSEAEKIHLGSWSNLKVAASLRRCPWCGTDQVASCSCQKSHGCPASGVYRYPCLFCKELKPATASAKDLASLRIMVTDVGYDNIGAILSDMKLNFTTFKGGMPNCDILFINCKKDISITPENLRAFVEQGGCVYASDWGCKVIAAAFPGYGEFRLEGKSGTLKAHVQDPEMVKIVGSSIDVSFDLGAWAKVTQCKGTTLMSTLTFPPQTLMYTFTYGKGSVFFTSFHNHAQASESEQQLLKVMLARQIGSVTAMTAEEVLNQLGVKTNISL